MNLYECTCLCGCNNSVKVSGGYVCDSCIAGACRSKKQK